MSLQPEYAETPRQRFEVCLSKLERAERAAGVPLNLIAGHPAIRPLVSEMLELLDTMDAGRGPARGDAEVISLADARLRLRG